MKSYIITVNGVSYDVTVEEVGAVQTATPVQVAPVTVPKAAPKAAAKPAATGSITVSAPMPGKILGIKSSVGASVKKGDVILVLEAMKMENEIVAPEDGTIASINIVVGDSVEAGAVLATLN